MAAIRCCLHGKLASEWAYLDIILIVLPVAAFVARSRTVLAVITLAYLPLSIFDTAISL
jgi:hypothetical protein